MSVNVLHPKPSHDRAMRPEAVLDEIIGKAAGKTKRWLYTRAPKACRWNTGAKTDPPLFSEQRTRAWWVQQKQESAA